MANTIKDQAEAWGSRLGNIPDGETVPKAWFLLSGPELIKAMQEDRLRLGGYDNGLLIEYEGESWTLAHAPEAEKFLTRSG